MSIERFVRQLRREASRNPKKAAILGLLVLVALYFWAPLVWGLVGSEEAAGVAASEMAVAATPEDGLGMKSPAGPAAEAPKPMHSWQTLVKWREQDPRTTAADTLKFRRDPFRAVQTPLVEEEEAAETEEEIVEAILTPEALGLKLSSTIVGPQRRVALVNGKTYREGQLVPCTKNGQQIAFRLAEVHPWRIVLEREGKRFELAIPRKTLNSMGN